MKTINRTIVLLIASMSLSFQLFGQSPTISLNSSLTGNHVFTASQAVTLSSGFSYDAQSANTFKAQVLPLSSFNFTEPTTTETPVISTLNPIGTIQGKWGVSTTGAATYTIPIKVAPGINGIEPNLSIVYSSQSSYGSLGLGWNVTGFSSISRVGSDIYHDGNANNIHFNSNDHFALDGQRLIPVSLSSGSTGIQEFRTEDETFSRITAYAGTNGNPQYFIVETKDGEILEYGKTTDSRFIAQGRSDGAILSWGLNKVSDRSGNYYKVTYYQNENTGEYHPLTIDYTGTSTTSTFNTVKLEYQARISPVASFVSGSQVNQDSVIKNIYVKNNGSVVGQYNFTYNTNSRLVQITEYGDNNSKLNPSVITWGTSNTGLIESNSISNSQDQLHITGDFNGDGISDVVIVKGSGASITWNLYLGNSNGTFTYTSSGSLPSLEKYFTYGPTGILAGDFNGDGLTDLIILGGQTIISDGEYPTVLVSNGTNFITNTSSSRIYYPGPTTNSEIPSFNVGDFDGDGIAELFVSFNYDPGLGNNCFIYKITGLSKSSSGSSNINMIAQASLPLGDYTDEIDNNQLQFSGDGKTDLMNLYDTGNKIYEYQNGSINQISSSSIPNMSSYNLFGDINGDGKTDILSRYKGTWFEVFSTGTSFTTPKVVPTYNNFDTLLNSYYLSDIDGDGKSDFVAVGKGNNSANAVNIYVAYSTGQVSTISPSFNTPITYSPSTTLSANSSYNNFGDYNGDGTIDMYYDDGTNGKMYTFNRGVDQNLVSKIQNGFGLNTIFSYAPLTNSSVYTAGISSPSSSDVINFNDPLYVVSSVNMDDISGTSDVTNYNYFWGQEHRLGKGFLGFYQITSRNPLNNIDITNQYGYDDTYFDTNLSKINKFTDNDNKEISLTEYTYSTPIVTTTPHTGSNSLVSPHFTYISKVVSTDYLTGIIKTATKYVDDNGNPQDIKETFDDGSYNETSYSNYTSSGSWMDARPGTITVTKKHYQDSNPAVTLTTNYTYHPITGKDSIVIGPDGLETDYHYYGNGNLKTLLQTDNTSHRLKHYEYDALGQFVTDFYNAVGQKTQYTHDYMGNVTSITDPNGLITTKTYDDYGRLSSTKASNGFITNMSYNWATGLRPSNAVYYTLITSKGLPSVTKYYDWFGRVLRTETTGFDGTNIYTSNVYNGLGQITQSSLPYYAGQQAYAKSYTYDEYGRLTETTDPSNDNSFSYNDKTTQVINGAGQTKSSTKDSQGNILTSTDAGGTVTNTYSNWGKPNSISVNGTSTTISYDNYGRQLTITDPDAGTTSYKYNEYNDITYQSDSKGNSNSMTYSVMGRDSIITNNKEGTTNYYYDATGSIGLLSKVTYPGGEEDYTYDTYDRLSGDSKTITDGSTNNKYTFYYKHDIQGRDSIIKYPSDITVQDFYNSNGYLYQVMRTDNATLVWYGTGANALGQYTQSHLGDQLTMTHTYSASGQLTGIQTGSVQNLMYTYNYGNGNLLCRSDAILGLTENFTYDDLNRLTGVSGPSPITTAYDNSGNITSKASIGSYTYGNQPHAVASVTNPNNLISNTEQDITYNGFNKVDAITEGGWNLTYKYDGLKHRTISKLYQNGNLLKTSNYFGDYEKETIGGNIRQLSYIHGGSGLAAILVQNSGKDTMYYVHTDNQGSYDVITNSSGTVLQKYSFDAWGRRRNHADWTYTNLPSHSLFSRGYTGHEHLDAFNLINMNGRVYDPLLARFLSADNYVQQPDYSQNYNRYSYCFNNPLIYTDPNGNIALIDDGILGLIGGTINLVSNLGNIHSLGQGLGYFGVGFVGGALSEYISPIGSAALVGAGNAALGSYSRTGHIDPGAVIQGAVTSSIVSGLTFGLGQAFPIPDDVLPQIESPVLRAALSQGIYGTGIGSISGGLMSVMNGGNFWQGSEQGAFWGGGLGFANGVYSGFQFSEMHDLDPWTGTPKFSMEPLQPIPAEHVNSDYISPNEKGRLGVERAIQQITTEGGTILAREVTLEVNGFRVRVDIAADFNGKIQLIEVKNGPSAGFTPNQNIVYPQMELNVPIIPRGSNAVTVWGPNQIGQSTTEYELRYIKYK